MNFRRGRNEFKTNDRRRGFTLLEMSVVLIIIALVTGMAISAGISTVTSARQAATINKMKAIDQALMAYRVANNRLPCPGDLTITPGSANFGIEAGGSSVCTTGTGVCTGSTLWAPAFTGCVIATAVVPSANHSAAGATFTKETGAEGALPVITLGLPKDMMVDGWGNSFRYAVDTTMTEIGAFHDNPVDNTCGAITVNETNGSARTKDAIYALISHGPNGHGAYTPYTGAGNPVTAGSTNAGEQTNCHCDATGTYNSAYAPTYVQALPSITTPGTATTAFDDIVTYKERWQMATPWDPVATIYIADTLNNVVRKVQGCIITTIAGTGTAGYSGDGSAATSAKLNNPYGIGLDSSGNIYFSDSNNYRIRKVTASTGIITTVAGTGTFGYSGDGGAATSAKFNGASGIKLDSSGNIYFADSGNNRVRKITASTGIISTIAGNGTNGYSGNNGQATNAALSSPQAIAFDSSGNLYIADFGNVVIRKVMASTGIITTVAGNRTQGYSGNGGAATSAEFYFTNDVAVDSFGNIYIADGGNGEVRKVTAATGIITSFAGAGPYMNDSGNGGAATSAGVSAPYSIALDSAGNLYFADWFAADVRKVAASTRIITTPVSYAFSRNYNGNGGPATSAGLNYPYGIAIVPSFAVSHR